MTRIVDGDELPEGDAWCYEATIQKKDEGGGTISFNTEWVGYADKEGRIELRQPRLLSRNDLISRKSPFTGKPIQTIQTPIELACFWIAGGHAAIDYDLAQAEIAKYLAPKPFASSTGNGPFDAVKIPIKFATIRAPTKKLRMQILERDQFRCMICGQRAADDVNVTLHVHHIRPWSKNGATVPSNLITLCHTCHGGLDPHYNLKLAWIVNPLWPEKKRKGGKK